MRIETINSKQFSIKSEEPIVVKKVAMENGSEEHVLFVYLKKDLARSKCIVKLNDSKEGIRFENIVVADSKKECHFRTNVPCKIEPVELTKSLIAYVSKIEE